MRAFVVDLWFPVMEWLIKAKQKSARRKLAFEIEQGLCEGLEQVGWGTEVYLCFGWQSIFPHVGR